ncbi:putative uncharacterized protein [Odoribacter splanchnicus CAG:14]|nr:hypothetical protein [Odoribacter splanchnicus]CDB06806.1 putative uncharacterized protein [Odoribacter splanchnicus CAG:14]
MAAEEEYQRTGFEGKDLKAIDTLLHTYFDASGWEFCELIQANRNYYIKQGASPHPDQYEFFKDKDIIIDYPIDLYTKLEDFTRNDEYLITDDRQDTIIWLLPDFYSYNFASSKLFEATNDSGFYYFSEFVRPKDLKVIDTLLRTYFDASGWEFSELIQANRISYSRQPMIMDSGISRSPSGLICSGYLDPCTNYLQPKNLSISWVFPPSL